MHPLKHFNIMLATYIYATEGVEIKIYCEIISSVFEFYFGLFDFLKPCRSKDKNQNVFLHVEIFKILNNFFANLGHYDTNV